MAQNEIERLHYYQRQFLGAADFNAQQAYHRDMRRRHHLAHHTWGIVVGLELTEQTREDDPDARDVYVQPGMAVDGFGREILVLSPYKLDLAPFDGFINLLHREVWIAYDEELARRPAAGYEVCEEASQFARVREGFRLVVEPGAFVHEKVIVDGKEAGPPPPVNPGDPLTPPDESVPYQELPDDEDAPRWLVRLGSVRWDGPKRRFVAADPGKLAEGRRHVGAVTAHLLAPAAQLLIRDRATDTPLPAGKDGVAVTLEGSLEVERLIHGKADAHIDGSVGIGTTQPAAKLHVSADDARAQVRVESTGNKVRLDLAKAGAVQWSAGVGSGPNDSDLWVAARSGQQDPSPTRPALYVQQTSGNVGVATAQPTALLTLASPFGTRLEVGPSAAGLPWSQQNPNVLNEGAFVINQQSAGSQKPEADLALMRDRKKRVVLGDTDTILSSQEGGNVRLHVNFEESNDKEVLRVTGDGNVGIGTASPLAPLTVSRPQHLNAIFERTDTLDHLTVVVGSVGSGLRFSETNAFFIASQAYGNRNDGGFGTEHLRILSTGSVGVGTSAPQARLQVKSLTAIDQGNEWANFGSNAYFDGSWKLIDASQPGVNMHIKADASGQEFAFARAEANLGNLRNIAVLGSRTSFIAEGKLALGHTSPQCRLHVTDAISTGAGQVTAHVALIENTSAGANADVLALKVASTNPGAGNNFITFFAGNAAVGRIEGSGGGGVSYASGGADFAECLERLDAEERLEPGDVVGIIAGRVSKRTAGAPHVSAVTDRPAVLGNVPSQDAEGYVKTALLGQVAVKVRGPVTAGDYILASGLDDGTGIAVPAQALAPERLGRVLGVAWESSGEASVKRVKVAMGLWSGATVASLAERLAEQARTIGELREAVAELRAWMRAQGG